MLLIIPVVPSRYGTLMCKFSNPLMSDCSVVLNDSTCLMDHIEAVMKVPPMLADPGEGLHW